MRARSAGSVPGVTTPPPAGWHLDPTGRHEQRYSDGVRWTEHVADGQATAVDPYTDPVPPPPAPLPPPAAVPQVEPPATAAPADPTLPDVMGSDPVPPAAPSFDDSLPGPGAQDTEATDAAWSAIDEPIAPDPTAAMTPPPGALPAPPFAQPDAPVGQPAPPAYGQPAPPPVGQPIAPPMGQPGPYQAPPPYGAMTPGAPPPESGGGTRWGLIALIGFLLLAVVGGGAVIVANLAGDDDGDSNTTTTPVDSDAPAGDSVETIAEFGDDAELDNLARACENGDWDSCDDLYLDSDFGSGYETYGDTCGGRNTPQGWCRDLY